MRLRTSLFLLLLLFLRAALGQTYTIHTLAGGGVPQDIPGVSAGIGEVSGIAVDGLGNTFLSLVDYDAVVRLDPKGILTAVAGNGFEGYGGDNGPATSPQ